jgi:hypothetical protein
MVELHRQREQREQLGIQDPGLGGIAVIEALRTPA